MVVLTRAYVHVSIGDDGVLFAVWEVDAHRLLGCDPAPLQLARQHLEEENKPVSKAPTPSSALLARPKGGGGRARARGGGGGGGAWRFGGHRAHNPHACGMQHVLSVHSQAFAWGVPWTITVASSSTCWNVSWRCRPTMASLSGVRATCSSYSSWQHFLNAGLSDWLPRSSDGGATAHTRSMAPRSIAMTSASCVSMWKCPAPSTTVSSNGVVVVQLVTSAHGCLHRPTTNTRHGVVSTQSARQTRRRPADDPLATGADVCRAHASTTTVQRGTCSFSGGLVLSAPPVMATTGVGSGPPTLLCRYLCNEPHGTQPRIMGEPTASAILGAPAASAISRAGRVPTTSNVLFPHANVRLEGGERYVEQLLVRLDLVRDKAPLAAHNGLVCVCV